MSAERDLSKEKIIVAPGSVVGVAEEFIPGRNIIEVNGFLYSTVLGFLQIDMKDRVANVEPVKRPKRILPEEYVYAVITQTRGDIAIARIIGRELVNTNSGSAIGILHVSQVPHGSRLRGIDEYIRVGDIIYAKVVSRSQPYFLSMRSQKASIVVSLCPKCGSIMGRLKERLVCPVCEYSETRSPITMYLYRLSELKKH